MHECCPVQGSRRTLFVKKNQGRFFKKPMAYKDHAFAEEIAPLTHAFSNLPHVGPNDKKRIKLALQGGGAYGAYTTGVVIQLLLDPRIEIVEIAGTSAGEKIALIVADRINKAKNYDEGRQAAVEALLEFWGKIVHESAPVMHALDVADQPMNPAHWQRFFSSVFSVQSGVSNMMTPFDFWRQMMPDNLMVQRTMAAMESPWKTLQSHAVFGSDLDRRPSPNLPALEDIARRHGHISDRFESATRPALAAVPRGYDVSMGSLKTASTAVATEALRKVIKTMLTLKPLKNGDFLCEHAASGKFIKVFINTAKEMPDGSLVNCVHTGNDLTLNRSMGSSALMGFFDAPVIDGHRHWDGGYTENTCISALAESTTDCDGIMIVGTNRPIDTKIIPRMQRDIPRRELGVTKGLIWHQMYPEAVLHAEAWKKGAPTWHMVTYNHAPECDWTAKQNTFDWHIRMLIQRGQTDGISELATSRPFIGVMPTISRERLERIAEEGKVVAHIQNHSRSGYGSLHAA